MRDWPSLTLDEAARLTKIRPSRLAEIEADDFFAISSLAYAKGFLQIYGKFLDVDVTPYLDAFETSSQQMTVDGYAYLQDQPAPKPRRIRARPRAPVVRRQRSGDRSSPLPLLIAVGVIALGFILMRLIMNIQRMRRTNGRRSSTDRFASSAGAGSAHASSRRASSTEQAPAASIAPVRAGSVRERLPVPRCGGRSSTEESSSGCKRTSIDCARAVTSSSDCK